jgi:hypothetical protein
MGVNCALVLVLLVRQWPLSSLHLTWSRNHIPKLQARLSWESKHNFSIPNPTQTKGSRHKNYLTVKKKKSIVTS